MPQTQKILVFSAGFGEGHNTAAHNLCTALLEIAPGRVDAQFVDIFARRHPRTNDILRRGYLTLMNRAPRLWSAMYRLFDSTEMVETNLAIFGTLRDALAELLEKERPDAVVATYPLYGYLLNAIAKRGGPADFLKVVVVTDSISINSIWYRCGSDFFSVPNEETAAALRLGRVAPEKIRVLGFPVELRFAHADTLPPRPDPAGPEGGRVLYMINAGRRAAEEVLRGLLALPDIALTVTVGRDLELRATVERLIGAYDRTRTPVQVIGWTREVPALLASHHVLISKAGGATTQEAIAAKCPMIISQVAPGQEEGNAQLLADNQAGCVALTPERICAAVQEAFADDAKVCRAWTQNISRLSRPGAALDNARFILEQIEARGLAKASLV
jgi:processive 1,2-diacylglycerol beta-glucosyltransferase